jgi:UDP-N-acetylmuramyl pentapeptide phosphotransferase/UDP-N-acetylglucosamine-1-phosphate transferase
MEMVSIIKQFIPLIVALGAFIIAYRAIGVIIDVSHLKNLFDNPLEKRKVHANGIPHLGGIGIFIAIFVSFSLSGYATQIWSPYLAAGMTLLLFSGIKDDILVIDPNKKLLVQIFAIVALMWGGNLVITDLGGVFGVQEISYTAGFALTFFTMIVVVNAYNLIDGIDGLAGGIGVMASAFFGWWFWEVGMIPYATLSISLTGSLLGFLVYNFQPASVFMGDTGSQIIGYVLAFLSVTFVKTGITATGAVPFQDAVPVLVLSVLIVPLYDTLRVFVVRLFNGKSPFSADRRHVHHQIIDFGFSHRSACYILYAYTLGIIGLTISLSGMDVNILLGTVLLTTVLLFPTVHFKRKLVESLGFEMPSSRQVKVFEMKYGMAPPQKKTVGRNGPSDEEDNEDEQVVVAK